MTGLAPLPKSLRGCRPVYDLYRRSSDEAQSGHDDNAYTLAYLFGLDAVRVLMDRYDAGESCGDYIEGLVQQLEQIKSRQAKKDGFTSVIGDDKAAKVIVCQWATDKLSQVDRVFKAGKVDGSTVQLLMDACVGFQVALANDAQVDEFSSDELGTKIRWCQYHIRRILDCFKKGTDPNEDLAGMLGQPPLEEDPISQQDIDKVISEAMSKEFDNDDEYYDSDEGEFVKRDQLSSKLPEVPGEAAPATDELPSDAPLSPSSPSDPLPSVSIPSLPTPSLLTPSLTAAPPSAASLIAKQPRRQDPPKPVDLESLELQLNNSQLLDNAAKCCRFAISAIGYEDISTAIDEVKESLKLLETYREKTR